MALTEKLKKIVGLENAPKGALGKMMAYNTENIGVAAASQVTSPNYTPFLTDVEQLSIGQATSMMFLRSIWDAVIDPFIGVFVDRTRSSFGKHRIYILTTALPYGICFFLLWWSFGLSQNGTVGQVFGYHLFVNLALATVSSFLTIAHGAMLPTLAPGYFERTQYISVGYICNSLGMVPAYFFSTALFGLVNTKDFTPALKPTFQHMGMVMGLVCTVFILICAFTTKEKSSKGEVHPKLDPHIFFGEFKTVFRNKAFRQYFAMTFLYLFGSSFASVSSPYFLKTVADRWDKRNLLVLLAGIAEMSAFPLNFALTKKFGKQKCAWITCPLLLLSLTLGLVIRPAIGGMGIVMTALLILREVCHSVGYSGIAFTTANIFPDVTDVDEMITGRRREGTITTFSSFIKTMTSGFMASVVGIILEWFGVNQESAKVPMFTARAAVISPALNEVFGLRLTNAVLPLVFLILSLLSLRKYEMTREDHELMRHALARRRAIAEAAFAEANGEETKPLTQADKERLSLVAGQPWEAMWIGKEELV